VVRSGRELAQPDTLHPGERLSWPEQKADDSGRRDLDEQESGQKDGCSLQRGVRFRPREVVAAACPKCKPREEESVDAAPKTVPCRVRHPASVSVRLLGISVPVPGIRREDQ